MDINWFTLQEWIQVDKDIIFIHVIPGILNMADTLSKAFAWVKHHRQMSLAMGATGPIYLDLSIILVPTNSNAIETLCVQNT